MNAASRSWRVWRGPPRRARRNLTASATSAAESMDVGIGPTHRSPVPTVAFPVAPQSYVIRAGLGHRRSETRGPHAPVGRTAETSTMWRPGYRGEALPFATPCGAPTAPAGREDRRPRICQDAKFGRWGASVSGPGAEGMGSEVPTFRRRRLAGLPLLTDEIVETTDVARWSTSCCVLARRTA